MATGGGGDSRRYPVTDPRDRSSYSFTRGTTDDTKINHGRLLQANSVPEDRLNNWVCFWFHPLTDLLFHGHLELILYAYVE